MGVKYGSQATSGYNSSAPTDAGAQAAENLVTWAGVKTKLADVLKTFGEAINTALVAAFDYSVRQVTASDNTVAGDHMRCVEIGPTVSAAVTVSLMDATTATSNYMVRIKNSSTISQTVGRVTGGDTIDGTAANVTIPSKSSITFQTIAAATGYLIVARSGTDFPGLIDAAGDLIVGTAADTAARLAIGTARQVLQVNAGATAPEWGVPTLDLIASATASASATIDFTSISNAVYDSYMIVGNFVQPANDGVQIYFRVSQAATFNATASNYQYGVWRWTNAATGVSGSAAGGGATAIDLTSGAALGNAANEEISFRLCIDNCAQTTEIHRFFWEETFTDSTPVLLRANGGGEYIATGAIDGFRFLMSSGNIASGTFKLYGLRG